MVVVVQDGVGACVGVVTPAVHGYRLVCPPRLCWEDTKRLSTGYRRGGGVLRVTGGVDGRRESVNHPAEQ